VQQQRRPDEEGEGVMREVGDEHARLNRPLEPMNLGVPPMAHGLSTAMHSINAVARVAGGRAGA